MSVTVIVGSLTAGSGMYLSLVERSSSQESAKEKPPTDDAASRFTVPRSTIYQAATFVGLAILGISQGSVPESSSRSILADGMRGTVFCLGACLTLAGAVGVVFSSSAQSVVLSLAILGTGGATVLGVSGNAIIGGLLLAVAALSGWWLHSTSKSESSPTKHRHHEQGSLSSNIEQALRLDPKPITEPLLTSVAIVLFCWVLTSTIQTAIQEGGESATTMSGSVRALPRPAYPTTEAADRPSKNDAAITTANSESSSRETTLFWCAAGLLAATIGLGYSRSDDRPSESSKLTASSENKN